MIRRPWTIAGSSGWILIRQTDHAVLAGHIARFWRAACAQRGSSAPGNDWDTVLAAIDRHDDGWRAWEDTPLLDADQGRPYNFLEVPDEIATRIWRRSIEQVADLGPLAQYLVASHFLRLRRNSSHWQTTAARKFLADFEPQTARWLSEWSNSAASRKPELAQVALEQLQQFDYCSLWLCGAIDAGERSVELPGGPILQWTLPRGGPDPGAMAERRIVAHPWPLHEASVRWSVPARYVATQRYASATALAASCHGIDLHWTLHGP